MIAAGGNQRTCARQTVGFRLRLEVVFLLPEHRRKFAEVVERFVQPRCFGPRLPAGPVALAQRDELLVRFVLLEPAVCPSADCAVGNLVSQHVVFDQPCSARGDDRS